MGVKAFAERKLQEVSPFGFSGQVVCCGGCVGAMQKRASLWDKVTGWLDHGGTGLWALQRVGRYMGHLERP